MNENVEESSENVPVEAELETSVEAETKPVKRGRGKWLAIILVCVFCLLVAAVYFAWHTWGLYQKKDSEVSGLHGQLEQTRNSLTVLKAQQEKILSTLAERDASFARRMAAAEQQLEVQHKRLMSMSTTTRDDWLLAEAEYLLRLANQRVLIERSADSADGLLVEADNILRDLNDPDLSALRQALANDLAELRLIEKIDRDGIYFQLVALAAQAESLPLRPARQEIMGSEENNTVNLPQKTPEALTPAEEKSRWQKFKSGFSNVFSVLDNYVRVRNHSVAPPPLLAPESAVYLQQNLRIKIERAQLALLREQQAVFASSLSEVDRWLEQYYPQSHATNAFKKQIDGIKNKKIVQSLPDITQSLELLHDYIENLHNLNGVKPDNARPNGSTDQGAESK